jgi:Fe-Mn family superoxide dismutase
VWICGLMRLFLTLLFLAAFAAATPLLLPKLPYSYDALEPVISEKLLRLHHQKHHQTYTDKLNVGLSLLPGGKKYELKEMLKNLESIPEQLRDHIRNNGGGYINHEMFFANMRPVPAAGDNLPSDFFRSAIDASFGSFATFKASFTTAAMSVFGSGWTWLIYDPLANGTLLITTTPNQDTPLSDGKVIEK